MKIKRIISIAAAAIMLFCSIGLGNIAEAANLTKEQQEQFEKAIANGGVWINFGDLEFSTPIQIPDVTAEEFILPDTPSFSDVTALHSILPCGDVQKCADIRGIIARLITKRRRQAFFITRIKKK